MNTMLYIDTKTGTYGEAKDLRLVRAADSDVAVEIRQFDFMADSEIIDVAVKFGEELMPLLPERLK